MSVLREPQHPAIHPVTAIFEDMSGPADDRPTAYLGRRLLIAKPLSMDGMVAATIGADGLLQCRTKGV
jgi:hypothetical protein